MPSYAVYAGDLLTGQIYAKLPVADLSWANVMDDADTISITLALGDPTLDDMEPVSVTSPCKNYLAVAYTDDDMNETFLAGGPIWAHDYDDESGQLTVTASGMWSYFDHRKVMQVLAGLNPATVTAAYTGLSLGTIAKRLIQLAATHTGGSVPIVLPADEAITPDAAHDRTYPGYELDWVGDMLRNLTGVIGGPEIQFRPQRQSDPRFLQWVLVTGTSAQPLISQVGADLQLDATVEQSPVEAISVHVDGTAMADEAWVKGNGDAESTIIGHALGSTLTNLGYALFEADITGHDDVSVQATADGYASGSLQFSTRPALTLTVKIGRDTDPNVVQYSVGDYTQIIIPAGHRYFSDGATYRSRIVQKSGDTTNLVTLQLATVPE